MKKFSVHIACCFFLVVVCLVACVRPPAATITEKNDSSRVQKDSTWRKETSKPQLIYLPGDTVRIETLIECDEKTNKPKDMTAKVRGKNSDLEIKLRNGLLSVISQYDSAIKVIHTKEVEINHLRETVIQLNKNRQEVKIVKEFKTRWYDYVARVLAALFLIIIALRHYRLI